jgi:hypothetical protein
MSGVMLRTILKTLAFPGLDPPTLQECSASRRYLLRVLNYQTIESGYAVQPGPPDLGRPCQPCRLLPGATKMLNPEDQPFGCLQPGLVDCGTVQNVARLDGMPLAIELAAARCPTPGPVQLAARLDGHPGLLSGGAARPGRHRSLEALVSWSYELLGEAERRLLERLSVLRGDSDLTWPNRSPAASRWRRR